MPFPKRVIEPVHISRGTVPDADQYSVQNELEAVTNGTLANAIRQLSSLSRHAEDLFGELAKEAHAIATRANSLQARLDKLAIKTTQLDSTVEEVSLQEMHMRKAFKSAVVFDQQVVSRDTMPTAMLETYNQCDKPPPLYKLNPYREDGKDGMKFYTDPDYFFHLWRQEMLKDTERMMMDRGKKPHKPRSADSSGGRHKKRVRQPYNTRERQKQIAVRHGEYIMPNSETHYAVPPMQQVGYEEETYTTTLSIEQRPSRPNSIELRRNYSQHVVDSGIIYSPSQRHSPTADTYYNRGIYTSNYEEAIYQRQPQQIIHNHQPYQYQLQQQQQPQQVIMSPLSNHSVVSPSALSNEMFSPNGTPTRGSRVRPSQPPPAPPSTTNSNSSTPSASNTPTRGRSMSTGRETLPPPPPPPVEMPLSSTPPPQELPPPPSSTSHSPPPACNIPPPPPPPPPLPYTVVSNGPSTQIIANGDVGKSPIKSILTSPAKISPTKQQQQQQQQIPSTDLNASGSSTSGNVIKPKPIANGLQYDPRTDLLKAIRDGIKLRKVEKIEQKEGEKGVNALHDVASILARRVAVEISDSESGSEESEYDSDGWAEQETAATTH